MRLNPTAKPYSYTIHAAKLYSSTLRKTPQQLGDAFPPGHLTIPVKPPNLTPKPQLKPPNPNSNPQTPNPKP